jgi:hypothetical protein
MPKVLLTGVEPTKPWSEMTDDEIDELVSAIAEKMLAKMTSTKRLRPCAGDR